MSTKLKNPKIVTASFLKKYEVIEGLSMSKEHMSEITRQLPLTMVGLINVVGRINYEKGFKDGERISNQRGRDEMMNELRAAAKKLNDIMPRDFSRGPFSW